MTQETPRGLFLSINICSHICKRIDPSKHAHEWHLGLSGKYTVSSWSTKWWLTLCFVVSLDGISAACWGDRRMAKVGHGGLPGYFWWHLMLRCVRISPDMHADTYVCKCVYVRACAWEDVQWQALCSTLIIALMCCCFHPCGNEVDWFATAHLSCARDKTALVIPALWN